MYAVVRSHVLLYDTIYDVVIFFINVNLFN